MGYCVIQAYLINMCDATVPPCVPGQLEKMVNVRQPGCVGALTYVMLHLRLRNDPAIFIYFSREARYIQQVWIN